MLNTAGAYFIRESGGTFLGDKGHSCHPRIQCKYRYYQRKFQIIRGEKVHMKFTLVYFTSPWPFSSKLEWLIWLIEKGHIRIYNLYDGQKS